MNTPPPDITDEQARNLLSLASPTAEEISLEVFGPSGQNFDSKKLAALALLHPSEVELFRAVQLALWGWTPILIEAEFMPKRSKPCFPWRWKEKPRTDNQPTTTYATTIDAWHAWQSENRPHVKNEGCYSAAWDIDGEPCNLKAAAADALEWLNLIINRTDLHVHFLEPESPQKLNDCRDQLAFFLGKNPHHVTKGPKLKVP